MQFWMLLKLKLNILLLEFILLVVLVLGDKNFAEFFDNNVPNAFRITHYKDVVPHVPIISMGFEHT